MRRRGARQDRGLLGSTRRLMANGERETARLSALHRPALALAIAQ
jgi:hypothetical protein